MEGEVKEDPREVDATGTVEPAPVTEDLADELLMPLDWLRQTARQLEHARQMIFYGPPVAGLLRRWPAKEGLSDHPARLLDELNARLADPDRAIGPSYLMNRHVADPGGLELVWSTQILPLLEDQYHGTGVDVEQEYGLEALRTAVSSTGPEEVPKWPCPGAVPGSLSTSTRPVRVWSTGCGTPRSTH